MKGSICCLFSLLSIIVFDVLCEGCTDAPSMLPKDETPAIEKKQEQIPIDQPEIPSESKHQISDGDKSYKTALEKLEHKDYKAALPLLEQSCAEGYAAACFKLGMMYRRGTGVKASDKMAKTWFEQACQAGSTSGCDAVGH